MRSYPYVLTIACLASILSQTAIAQITKKPLPQRYSIDGPGGGIPTARSTAANQPVPTASQSYQSLGSSNAGTLTGQTQSQIGSGVPVSTSR